MVDASGTAAAVTAATTGKVVPKRANSGRPLHSNALHPMAAGARSVPPMASAMAATGTIAERSAAPRQPIAERPRQRPNAAVPTARATIMTMVKTANGRASATALTPIPTVAAATAVTAVMIAPPIPGATVAVIATALREYQPIATGAPPTTIATAATRTTPTEVATPAAAAIIAGGITTTGAATRATIGPAIAPSTAISIVPGAITRLTATMATAG